ncbi:putative carbamoylphosphate synthase large subunit [Diaporthe ampelina]|uniref:Putative carbamoylphosphate synthase large subunit n=1 Tax=Diaporthe ampelina TaxID=1214573 RepID=A0A0G2I5A4_9PEZI|nr:putative carbamoylphosphate synthase large subunit [Diaporthe ampelina]
MTVSQANGKSDIMAPDGIITTIPSLAFLRVPVKEHVKIFLLLALSIFFLPISYAIAITLTAVPPSVLAYFQPFSRSTLTGALFHRTQCRAKPTFRQRTILVTGVGMTKGLTLARAFWLCGYRVVAADFDVGSCAAWTPWKKGRWSYSLAFDAVYSLRRPVVKDGMDDREKEEVRTAYTRDICKIVEDEVVDLWVSCSGVASAVEDAMVKEALDKVSPSPRGRRRCACIQFDVPTTSTLHEKSAFIRHTKALKLTVPETFEVTSQAEVLDALASATRENPGRKFILKPVGMDDANRGNMTLLPLPTARETGSFVRRLPVSRARPWILQQFIRGGREYCTHALVVGGAVKVFAACPSSELLMHYEALPADDPLTAEMLDFTTKFAAAAGAGFTGHLSFDFMAEEDGDGGARLYAIECNPRAHTAVALFAQPGEQMRWMVEAYASAVNAPLKPLKAMGNSGAAPGMVWPPADATPRYWIGHDFVTRALLPWLNLLLWKPGSGGLLVDGVGELVQHVLYWKDGTFELWDPWPFVALYHHYWPRAILASWWKGEQWSRLNVSTTKMFIC